ncbi:hypothetical protein LC612_30830 [Nostoc sp. CHAB 5834]|nr:hypothetical protein [Nostoc sp. CHAB 5834]
MNLLRELMTAGHELTTSFVEVPSKRYPDRLHMAMELRLKLAPEGTELVHHALLGNQYSLQEMVVQLLTKEAPDHPILKAWWESKGRVPVRLVKDALENLGYAMTVAQRKALQGPTSCITFNSLPLMHHLDRQALWDACRQSVEDSFKSPQPFLLDVANALQEAATGCLELRILACSNVDRSSEQTYALQMMSLGTSMMDIQDWMYGWLAYTVEDVPQEERDTQDVSLLATA